MLQGPFHCYGLMISYSYFTKCLTQFKTGMFYAVEKRFSNAYHKKKVFKWANCVMVEQDIASSLA